MALTPSELQDSVARVAHWVEQRGYKGYEPADGNASPLHALTFGSTYLQRIIQQVVLRSPINLRPWLGIAPRDSSIARGYMAAGYITLHESTGRDDYRTRAIECLDWLMQHKSKRYPQFAWGNHYPYATRSGKLPQEEPIIVWTSLIGMAFLDGFEAFGDSRYLDVALSVCDWILQVPREKTSAGTCLSYHAFQQTSIHNSNMLGAAMLARTSKVAQRDVGLHVAREAMLYSCAGQLPDGAWYYGESPKHRWIDNFHTGYNLDCLKCYTECTGDRSFESHIRRGFQFFKDNFFEPNGRPKYYHNEVYPVDIQCASQAIETLALFAEDDPDALALAQRVAEWTIRNMQDRDGHFYYRDLGWTKVKTPLNHWGQGTMFKALTVLLSQLSAHDAHSAGTTGARPVSMAASPDVSPVGVNVGC